MKKARQRFQMVFQDPYASLNPRMRDSIAEAKGMRVANRTSLSASCIDQYLLDTPPFLAMTEAAVEIGLDAYKRQQAAIIARPGSLDKLALVKCATLVIVGDTDATTPPDEARVIHTGILGSRLEIVPDCDHCAPLENPALVNRLIEEVIKFAEQRKKID